MQNFQDRTAIVTGGASGIGKATVERLVAEGAKVACLDLAEYDPTDSLSGQSVSSFRVDITDRRSVHDAVEGAIGLWGRLDLLVNSAGIGAAGTVLDNDDAEWQKVIDTNLMGTVRVIQAAVPHLRQSPSAAIVNVASAVATTGFPNRALYSASKGAILSLTLAMAADFLREGIRVNAVCPGTTETPWVQRILQQAEDPVLARKKLVQRQLHGRLVSAEEVAEGIVYLLSPRAGSTNGVSLAIDSGINSLYSER